MMRPHGRVMVAPMVSLNRTRVMASADIVSPAPCATTPFYVGAGFMAISARVGYAAQDAQERTLR